MDEAENECEECEVFIKHKNADAETNHDNNKYSIDLRKVIMIPRMPVIKAVVFTKRITLYNETFVPIGTKKNLKSNGPPYAVTWHEGITKCDADDIASAFIKWLFQAGIRDHQHVIAWLDNCGSQGKNWIIYTALVSVMFSDLTNLQTLTLKYFEKGSSFMSTDSYHQVEEAMKKKNNINDFGDFVEALNTDGQAVILSYTDIIKFPKGLSKGKHTVGVPKIDQIVVVKFTENSSKLCSFVQWKYNYIDEYESAEFLMEKI